MSTTVSSYAKMVNQRDGAMARAQMLESELDKVSKQTDALRQDRDGLAALVEEWRRTLQTIRHCGYSELVVTHDTMGSAPHKVGLWADAALALTTAEALARQREKEKAT